MLPAHNMLLRASEDPDKKKGVTSGKIRCRTMKHGPPGQKQIFPCGDEAVYSSVEAVEENRKKHLLPHPIELSSGQQTLLAVLASFIREGKIYERH